MDRLFVTFGRRGEGHFIAAIDHIVTITDTSTGCEVCWVAGNETYRTPIANTAENALGLIEFEQEKYRRKQVQP